MVVDDHAAAVELHAGGFGAQAFGVGRAADGEQHLVGVDSATLGSGREADLQPSANPGDLGDLAVGVDRGAKTGQVLRVDVDEVHTDSKKDLGQHLEHGDLAAQRGEPGGGVPSAPPSADH